MNNFKMIGSAAKELYTPLQNCETFKEKLPEVESTVHAVGLGSWYLSDLVFKSVRNWETL